MSAWVSPLQDIEGWWISAITGLRFSLLDEGSSGLLGGDNVLRMMRSVEPPKIVLSRRGYSNLSNRPLRLTMFL